MIASGLTDMDDQRALTKAEGILEDMKQLLGRACVAFAISPTPYDRATLDLAATNYARAFEHEAKCRGIVEANERRWRKHR